MKPKSTTHRHFLAAACGPLFLTATISAQTTRTWDAGGATSDLLTATNWSGDTVPASTGVTAATRQDASFNGAPGGVLNLTYGAAFGGGNGVGLVLTGNQTSALNIANSAGTAQTLRIVNSTAATVGGIQIASGAGALTIGAAGTANPITLALGQGSTALNYYFANNSANTATIEENVTITKGSTHTATLIFDGTGSWNVKGVVGALSGTAGAGNVNIFGGSAVTLSGNNTYAGGATVSEGTLVVGHDNALGTGTINIKADATGEVARLQSNGTARTFTNAVTFGGAAAATANYLGGAGTGNLTFNGAVNWGSAAKTYTIDASTVTFSGAWTGASATDINGIDGTDTATSIVIMNGDRGTAAKQIDIGNNVTVRANHANSFGSDNTEPLGILGGAAVSVVELTNGITLARTLSLKGRSTETVALRSAGNNSVALSVAAGGTNYNIESTSGNLTISSVGGTADNQRNLFVTGAGNVTLADWAGRNDLTMNGSGTLTMGGTASSLSGTATVNSGTLHLNAVGGAGLSTISATGGLVINSGATVVTVGGGNSIGQTTAVAVNTGGLLDVRKNNVIGALSGAGTIRHTVATDQSLTVNNDNGTSTFSGVLEESSTGKLSLLKAGTGALTLSNTNTYTGDTTVSAGVLAVNGLLANTTTTVGNAATLQGSGSIGGSVTIQNGGTLAPGNSIESLGVGSVAFLAASTYAYELQTNLFAATPAASADLLDSTGTLDITAGAFLTLTDLATSVALANGSKLTLISYFGGWTSTGLFTYAGSTLNDGASFTLGANTWVFDYNDTTGGLNFAFDQANPSAATAFVTMTVSAVPEPNAAMLVGGIGLLALLRRRR